MTSIYMDTDVKVAEQQAPLLADYEKQAYIEDARPIHGSQRCVWWRWARERGGDGTSNSTCKSQRVVRWILALLLISVPFYVLTHNTPCKFMREIKKPHSPGFDLSPPETHLSKADYSDICPSVALTENLVVDFNSTDNPSFGVYQKFNHTHRHDDFYKAIPIHKSGEVRVKRADPATAHWDTAENPIHAELKITYSDPELKGLVVLNVSDNGLNITVAPRLLLEAGSGITSPSTPLCINVDVELYIAPDATFRDFNIVSIFLDQTFLPGLHLNVTNSTHLSTVSGDVSVPSTSLSSASCSLAELTNEFDDTLFDSRSTTITTVSGSIKGTFKLLDLLVIKSSSGSINADIAPGDAAPAPAEPKPAKLVAHTASGSIQVHFPPFPISSQSHLASTTPNTDGLVCTSATNVPARNYSVSAESVSGSITGEFFHGEYTGLKSTSGHVKAFLLPVIVSAKQSSLLKTDSTSSPTELEISDPLYLLPDDDDKTTVAAPPPALLDNFNGEHSTVSGTLKLHYPADWQGTITGGSTSGTLNVRGEGVEIVKKTRLPFHSQIVAKKGDGKSHVGFRTISGSVDLLVGEE